MVATVYARNLTATDTIGDEAGYVMSNGYDASNFGQDNPQMASLNAALAAQGMAPSQISAITAAALSQGFQPGLGPQTQVAANPAAAPATAPAAGVNPDAPDPNRPGYTNDGTPLGHDPSQAPTAAPAMAPGVNPDAPDPNRPGYTNDGTPLGHDPSQDTPAGLPAVPALPGDDAPAATPFSVPTKYSNTAFDIGAGLLGPLGIGVAGLNTLSGWMGGPTFGDGLNATLAALGNSSPGTPGSVTGSNNGRVSPQNAYIEALLANASDTSKTKKKKGDNGGGDPGSDTTPPRAPQGIQPIYLPTKPPTYTSQALYNPMNDPAVLRALGYAA